MLNLAKYLTNLLVCCRCFNFTTAMTAIVAKMITRITSIPLTVPETKSIALLATSLVWVGDVIFKLLSVMYRIQILKHFGDFWNSLSDLDNVYCKTGNCFRYSFWQRYRATKFWYAFYKTTKANYNINDHCLLIWEHFILRWIPLGVGGMETTLFIHDDDKLTLNSDGPHNGKQITAHQCIMIASVSVNAQLTMQPAFWRWSKVTPLMKIALFRYF